LQCCFGLQALFIWRWCCERHDGRPDLGSQTLMGEIVLRAPASVAYRTMSVLLRLRLPSALRVVVLGLLVLGMVMKPVLASACEIGDAQQVLAAQHQPAAAQVPQSGTESCCPAQNCNECCAHTVAMTPPIKVAATFHRATRLSPGPSRNFEPTVYPVGFRPPIVM